MSMFSDGGKGEAWGFSGGTEFIAARKVLLLDINLCIQVVVYAQERQIRWKPKRMPFIRNTLVFPHTKLASNYFLKHTILYVFKKILNLFIITFAKIFATWD